jgi:glutamate---cysteine ligase / carboxylate-amine ligase
VIEAHWGESSPFSLGLEEEIMILDAETLLPAPAVTRLLAGVEGRELPGRLKTELHASVVELNTDVCRSVPEAVEALGELRRAAAEVAEADGLRIAAAGAHPIARAEDLEVAAEKRYEQMVGFAGVTARRQGVNGLHVHVGMPSADACFAAQEWILPWLPLVLALSANSPYAHGEETGMASSRAEILAQLPRSGAPPALGSYDEWEEHVERLGRLGLTRDYTAIWWDVRPHPRFGTLEVRMPDQPTALERTGGLAALLQALCAAALDEEPRRIDPAGRALYQENRWAAARLGPAARLVHPDEERVVQASELARELVARLGPVAGALGSADELGSVDTETCEAEIQLAVGRERGLEALCADLVERSVASGS